MTYKELTSNSSIISIINEEKNEEENTVLLTIRVLNDTKWRKLIFAALKASHEDESFGTSIKQEFYLNESAQPAFIWTMVLWGDLDQASVSLSPILGKRGAPPPPPKSLGVTAPVYKNVNTMHRTQDGTVVTTVPLPFKARVAPDKEGIVSVRDSFKKPGKPRAFVEGLKS